MQHIAFIRFDHPQKVRLGKNQIRVKGTLNQIVAVSGQLLNNAGPAIGNVLLKLNTLNCIVWVVCELLKQSCKFRVIHRLLNGVPAQLCCQFGKKS
nr:hypothetical protein [Endozoicomonas acroporae]